MSLRVRIMIWLYIRFAPAEALRGSLSVLEPMASEWMAAGDRVGAERCFAMANRIRARVAVLERK